MTDALITVDELARRLDMQPEVIYKMAKDGKLPYHRVGSSPSLRFDWGEVRFDWEEVRGELRVHPPTPPSEDMDES